MATRTIKFDDFDQSEPAETVTFGLYGIEYEIDLSDDNAAELESLLQPYIDVARKKPGRSSPAASSGVSDSEKREWCRKNGVPFNPRGKLSKEASAAYNAAHQK